MKRRQIDIDDLLEEWSVHYPGVWENDLSKSLLLDGWYAVSNNSGIIAYFSKESDAFRYRLDQINRELNG